MVYCFIRLWYSTGRFLKSISNWWVHAGLLVCSARSNLLFFGFSTCLYYSNESIGYEIHCNRITYYMYLQLLTYIVVGLSFALYIGIAIWSRAGSTKDFYVAGGGVSPLANGMATAADWMSAASFISMAGIVSFSGYDGSVYLMGWTGGYVL